MGSMPVNRKIVSTETLIKEWKWSQYPNYQSELVVGYLIIDTNGVTQLLNISTDAVIFSNFCLQNECFIPTNAPKFFLHFFSKQMIPLLP